VAPTGQGAILFNWIHFGTIGFADVWRGTNKVAVESFVGGDIILTVTGNVVSSAFETTNINVQAVNSFKSFSDSPINNNLQPQLKVNQECNSICIPFSIVKIKTKITNIY
jgi:hypothetical protein